MERIEIRGMAHITGGGFYENVPRIFPADSKLSAVINNPLGSGYTGGWKVPPVFYRIAYGIKNGPVALDAASAANAQKTGEEILRSDPELGKTMFNTYNMGIGYVLALDPKDARKAVSFLEQKGFPAWEIGRVEKSSGYSGDFETTQNTSGIFFV